MTVSLSEPVLQARGLSRSVGERRLWHNLDCDLYPGERLGVVGPSGTGKSLLLRALAGLDRLDAGSIRFQHRELAVWHVPEYRSRVVYLPQRPAIYETTPEDAFELPFTFKVNREKQYSRPNALKWLHALGREADFLHRPGITLSGGEAQIVGLIRALLLEPDILLLDETTASLDGDTAAAVETAVRLWQEDAAHRACLWTSHDLHQIHRLTHRVLDLREAV